MKKTRMINVDGIEVSIAYHKDEDYISLTDIAKGRNGDDHIRNWLRNRNTLEFIGLWEIMNNPNFKPVEFDGFKKQAGLNAFNLSPKRWIESTNAIGIVSKAGRYGGTYAHKDIAFEFATWLSPVFKLWLIKEFQRLKDIESNQYNLEWSVKRVLAKANYRLHTDAIKEHIIPYSKRADETKWIEYANEADLLNVALYGYTAKEWKVSNPKLALEGKNHRDYSSINQLVVLANLESLNAIMIEEKVLKEDRFIKLHHYAKKQLETLDTENFMKSIERQNETTYLDIPRDNNKPNND